MDIWIIELYIPLYIMRNNYVICIGYNRNKSLKWVQLYYNKHNHFTTRIINYKYNATCKSMHYIHPIYIYIHTVIT